MDRRSYKYFIAAIWIVLFLFFLILRFPYSSISDWIEYRVEEKGDIELQIEGLQLKKDLSFFVKFIEIKKDFDKDFLQVGLKDLYLKPNIKMLIKGINAFKFKGKIAKGGINGRYQGGEEATINLSWERIGIKDIKLPLQKDILLPLANPTTGEASLFILKKKNKRAKFIDIKLKGKGIPSAGFKVPAIEISPEEIISGTINITLV